MKQYIIYFEIFGKKMKTLVHALSEDRAKERLKNMIVFHKVEEVVDKTKSDEFISEFEKIFKGFK